MELQADAVNTVSLVGRSRISFAFEDVSQVATTFAADYLCPRHTEAAIRVSRDSAWNVIKVGWPAAAGFEFVIRFVKRCLAAGAAIDTF